MKKSMPAIHHVRLVSCATTPGQRDVTIEIEGGGCVKLQFRADETPDIAQHVLIARHLLQAMGSDGSSLFQG